MPANRKPSHPGACLGNINDINSNLNGIAVGPEIGRIREDFLLPDQGGNIAADHPLDGIAERFRPVVEVRYVDFRTAVKGDDLRSVRIARNLHRSDPDGHGLRQVIGRLSRLDIRRRLQDVKTCRRGARQAGTGRDGEQHQDKDGISRNRADHVDLRHFAISFR